MLQYDRIGISESIDANKTNELNDCDVCCYCYLFDKGLNFKPYVGNECHDILIISMKLGDIAVLNININDTGYRCIISGISKSEAVNLLKNPNLTGKIKTL